MQKERRVLLVRAIVGRDTARRCPLNHDQLTNILSVEPFGRCNGVMLEVVQAIEYMGCYYTIFKLPDGTEHKGNIFFKAKDYTKISDTPELRIGLAKLIKERTERDQKLLRSLQKDKKGVERFIETFL